MTEETPKKKSTKKAEGEDAAAEKPKKAAAPKAKKETAEKSEAKAKKPAAAKKAEAAEAPAAEKPAKKEKAPKAKKEAAQKSDRTRLEDLKPAKGAKKAKLRVGRGRASGAGKTANRGHNGEGQRSGRSSKRGFEGGQMPLYRRLPKINGFQIINTKDWLALNTRQLEKLARVANTTELTLAWFEAQGLFNPKRQYGVRLYGNQAIQGKLTVEAHYATEGATNALQAAGGKVNLIQHKAEQPKADKAAS